MSGTRTGARIAGCFVLAWLLLVGFWAGAPMRPSALPFLATDHAEMFGAPVIFGALAELTGIDALAGWPGAWFAVARAVIGGSGEAAEHQAYALASVLGAIVVPLLLCAAIGPRRLVDLGLRRPPRQMWTLLAVALLALVPLAAGMAMHPGFGAELDARLAGSPHFLTAVIFGALAEHFFFHGVLLAWLHPSGVFPEAPAALLWPGRALDGGRRATVLEAISSLAIPRAAILPCLLSAPLFAAIHVGKPDAELYLSVLAGPVLAWLAYRSGGFVLPLVVHLSASVLAGAVVLAVRSVT